MKIAIFAAGTGGHILPAIEISKKFNHEEIIFFASNRPIEKAILKDKPFEVVHLNITGFRNIFVKNFFGFSVFLKILAWSCKIS
jgi:UDP-N-acetylglucosamine:LPS N-acetylglucosamine transferase